MKNLLSYIVCLLLIAMTFSCGETHYDSRLTAIDSIIEDRPDSALVELWALDYESLSGSDNRAYYALLLTQAQYKSYDSIPSTDTIEIAVAQFTSNGDREKHTRSLIYKDAILAGSFYQCDPLAEKYYSLSPYSWCAGNPLKFIDPSGNTIYAIIEDKTFVIQKDSNDIYQLYDSNNNTFSPIAGSFASDLISDINTIASGKRGNELLSFLENSENSVSIKDSHEGFISNITLNMIGYDQTASEGGLSFFYTSGYGTTRPQYIALAHEFAHIEDVWKGSFDTSAWYNSRNKVVSNAEKYAIFTENQIRKEHNQPLRLYYEHATLGFQGTNLYIPIRASSADLDIFDYIYLLINYSR